ncbi:ABC transporter permease [Lichenifustis flavocetrariae]|uniref:ABC transporter permease n=1 Tax=Lichenifustis flavocetrariae TaxID=2949735 RepID=A0AA41YV17_9HYPH|nr:ABC transporter permease [Lichenifustis flavocetrariae]MCW6509081.1 ABC transporter permease [Lichenifustis flavocetrariae]
MSDVADPTVPLHGAALDRASAGKSPTLMRLRAASEFIVIPVLAVMAAFLLFSLFLLAIGKSPLTFLSLLWLGGFGTAFSWGNTLQRASPLILTALAVAVPAQLGLTVIGGEGALVLGGFAAAAIAVPFVGTGMPALIVMPLMIVFALAAGGLWVGLAGWLRYRRGVNETISSLLLSYIAIAIMNFFVEGPMRDLNQPMKASTLPIGTAYMVPAMPHLSVHWGFATGVVLALVLGVLMQRTTFGFAAKITGGNMRAAQAQGLPVGRLILTCALISGACAGLAGYFEVAAVQGRANASLAAGYGFTGILVSFLARHNPIAVVPVAILFGGLGAAGGIVQRRMGMPDATVLVLQGFIFVVLLASETLYGRFRIFQMGGSGGRA